MERGHIGGDWQSLTGDRSVTVGVKRIRVDPGKWSTPAHVENSEEEIFFVLERLRHLLAERLLLRGAGRRLPRPHGEDGGAHPARRPGRARGARVRRAAPGERRAPAAGRRLLGPRRLGANRRSGGAPLEARGGGRRARGRRPRRAAGLGRQPRRRRARAVLARVGGQRRARPGHGRRERPHRHEPRHRHPGQAERAAARPLGGGGDLRRPRRRGRARAEPDAAQLPGRRDRDVPGARRLDGRAPGRNACRPLLPRRAGRA